MKKSIVLSALILLSSAIFSQNVAINITGSVADINAILDLNTGNSRNTGLLVPKVTLGASLSTFNPPMAHSVTTGDTGLIVFNSNPVNQPMGYYYWNGSMWVANGITQGYYTAKDSTEQHTTSSTYQTAASLTIPAGTFIITFSAEYANNTYDDDATTGTFYRFTDGTTIFGNSKTTPGDKVGIFIPVCLQTTMTYASPATLKLQWNESANNSAIGYIKNAIITAIQIK